MLLTLTNTNKKATIDDKNYTKVKPYKWFFKQVRPDVYYVATSIHQNGKTKTLYLHRLILQSKVGMDVHHKNRNPLDNQEENLEEIESMFHRRWHLETYRNKGD